MRTNWFLVLDVVILLLFLNGSHIRLLKLEKVGKKGEGRMLVDEANTPRKRDKHLIAYNPNPALEFPEKLYDPSLENSQKWMPRHPSTLRWLKNLLSFW